MAGMLDSRLLKYSLLGPVEVRRADFRMPISPGGHAEKIIAILLIQSGQSVLARELAELLGTTERAAHTAIYRLRGTFKAAGFEFPVPPRSKAGYRLEVEHDQVDANRFWDLADSATAAIAQNRLEAALKYLDEALSLWRGGEPIGGLDFPSFRQANSKARTLKMRRLEAELQRCDINLRLGQHWKALGSARSLAADHRLSQPVHERLVIAESRTLGPDEALSTCKDFRDRLDAERCSQPGASFKELQNKFSQGEAA